MDLTEYQAASLRTAGTTRDYWHRLAVAGMGVAGEAGEVLSELMRLDADDEALVGEIGDLLWYCAEIASTLGIDLSSVPLTPQIRGFLKGEQGVVLVGRACALCDYLKKVVRGTHEADVGRVTALLSDVLSAVEMVVRRAGTDIPTVCEKNICKLEARYPSGFPHVSPPSA